MKPYMKAIVTGLGGALGFVEMWLTPHSWPWVLIGAVIVAGTTAGVWRVSNVPAAKP